jgi:kumamolisin
MARHPLKGSERKPLHGASPAGKADPTERLEVSVVLRRRNADKLEQTVTGLTRRGQAGRHLSREEFEEQFGAGAADIEAVRKFAAAHGLSVVQQHAGRRTVILSGTVAQFNNAFGVDLQRFEHPGGSYRGRVGSIHLPDELHGRVEAVLGLDDRRSQGRISGGRAHHQGMCGGTPTAARRSR